MFKCHNNDLPLVITEQFKQNNDIHTYNTRQKHHLHSSVGHHEFIYKTFTFQGIYIWNTILKNVSINVSFIKFKYLLKSYVHSIPDNYDWHS